MNILEISKYGSLISIPLFALISSLLIRKTPTYSFKENTISKSINFITNPTHIFIFRLNFIIKGVLDFCFAIFIINHFNISYGSFISLMLFTSAFLFGSLAYFIEGKHTVSHNILTYTSGALWVIGQFALVRLIDDNGFLIFTIIALSTPLLLAFGFLFTKKTNVVVQAICMSIWYIWLLVLVFRYL